MTTPTHRVPVGIIQALHGYPLAITEAYLRLITTIAGRMEVPQVLVDEAKVAVPVRSMGMFPGKYVEGTSGLFQRGDVGILTIQGPILRYASWFERVSEGITGLDRIVGDFGVAAASPEIKSILLDIETPGGEMPADFATMVREVDSSVKPVTSFTAHWGTSAGAWIAASAGRSVADPHAIGLASIGVRAAFISTKRLEQGMGIDRIEMMASVSPKKIADPFTEDGREQIQQILDDAGEVFVADMARYRGLSRKRVISDFGQGAVLSAPRAAEAGLVDDLASIEAVVSQVSGGRRYRPTKTSVAASDGNPIMAKLTWREWFGLNADRPVPDHLAAEDDPPVVESRGGSQGGGDDAEVVRLRQQVAERDRQLAEEKRLRVEEAATRRKADLTAMVQGWIGKQIHPTEQASVLEMVFSLDAIDIQSGAIGDQSLLGRYKATIEARRSAGMTTDAVVNQKVPAGGKVETPPVAPRGAPGDTQAETDYDTRRGRALAGTNGSKS